MKLSKKFLEVIIRSLKLETKDRVFGVDISYVSDYLDNHQQLEMSLRENEAELKRIIADTLFKECLEQTQLSKITENLDSLEQNITKISQSQSHKQRVVVAADYLFVFC